jgi:hypothetical protein
MDQRSDQHIQRQRNIKGGWAPVLTPVILATQEAEIRRITVRS